MKIGIVGMSDGNGHPYSYSGIVNGYDDKQMIRSGWLPIYQYLKQRDRSDFGIEGARITHAWTQRKDWTIQLCKTCHIHHPVDKIEHMIGEVDAVIIARDDANSHTALALPFLQNGIPVFIDKPLAVNETQLKRLAPYLLAGQLMSCSAMRFARELDFARSHLESYGQMKLIQGVIVNDWEKYGIHLLDAAFSVLRSRPIKVAAIGRSFPTYIITMSDDSVLHIFPLGSLTPRVFNIRFVGSKRMTTHDITDNFSMFRRMIWHFVRFVNKGETAVNPTSTLDTIKVLIAGNRSYALQREVSVDEINI